MTTTTRRATTYLPARSIDSMSPDELDAHAAQLRAQIDRIEAELAAEDAARARFGALTLDEVESALADLGPVYRAAVAARDAHLWASIQAERATAPVEPLDSRDAGPFAAHIAEIDGEAVLLRFGTSSDDSTAPWAVECQWGGLRLCVDAERIGIALEDGDEDLNDMSLSTWGRLREITSAGVVEKLVSLARRYVK